MPQKIRRKNAGPSKEGGFMDVKQWLRVSWCGLMKKDNDGWVMCTIGTYTFIGAAIGFLLAFIFISPNNPSANILFTKFITGGAGILFISTCLYLWCYALFVNRRFKKVFGFWAPITPEGKNAFQCLVDQKLCINAVYFQKLCKTQENIQGEMKEINNWNIQPGQLEISIAFLETTLLRSTKQIKQKREEFRKNRKLASSKFLPISFEVLQKITDYENLWEEHQRSAYEKSVSA